MNGISQDATLVAQAPQLLAIEAIVLGLYLFFTMLSAWNLKSDRASFLPKTRFGEFFGLSVVLVFWGVFTVSLGVDQTVFALELAIAFVLAFIHPSFATGSFIVLLFLRPWEIAVDGTTLFGAIPRTFGLAALLSAFIYMVRSADFKLRLGTPVYLLLGFALWSFFSTFVSPDASAQSNFFDMFFKSIVLFILITQSVRDETGLRILKSSLIFAALGISSLSIYRTISTGDVADTRLGSFGLLADPNDTSAVMILIFPFALYALRKGREGSLFLRTICLATLISSTVLLYFAKSRGALLALLLTSAAMVLLRLKNKWTSVIAGLLSLTLFFPLSAVFNRSEADLSQSTQSRIIYWKAGALMALRSPVFGVGFGGYPSSFEQYAPKFIESGVRTAHSSWFLALGETGVVGLVLFASLYIWMLRTSWRNRKEYPELFFSVMGYGIAMSFLSHTYAIYFYILLGIVYAVTWLPRSAKATIAAILISFSAFSAHPSRAIAADEISVEMVRGSDKPLGTFVPSAGAALALSGSRGEVLNFQLKIRSQGCIKIDFRSDNSKAQLIQARFYSMPYVRTQHPSFEGAYVGSHHDPLVPLKNGEVCPEPSQNGSSTWSWVWGEVGLPATLEPGNYSAHLAVQSIRARDSGHGDYPVSIRVWKMTIPDEPAIPLYAEYSSWYGVLGHFGHTSHQEGALAQMYANEMREHRIQPMKHWVKVPKVVMRDGIPRLDLADSPEGQSSFEDVVLNKRPAWALFDFPKPLNLSPKDQELYWKAVEQEILARQLKGKAFVYLWDEPLKTDAPELVKLAELVRKNAPDLKILVTTSGYERWPRNSKLESDVDLFVPIMNDWGKDFQSSSVDVYRKLQSGGKELWTYLSCMSHDCSGVVDSGYPDWVLDRPSVWIRSMAWIWSRMSLNGFLYYDVDYAYQFYPKKDPWADLWYFTGNGDGTLFYPGRPGEHGLSEHQPIDSIRAKIWREASFDAEYIRWMQKLPHPPTWWSTVYGGLVQSPTKWSKSYADYQNLRDKAGEYLNSNL